MTAPAAASPLMIGHAGWPGATGTFPTTPLRRPKIRTNELRSRPSEIAPRRSDIAALPNYCAELLADGTELGIASHAEKRSEMMFLAALVTMNAIGASTLAVRSDGYPVIDVAPLCRGLTSSSSLSEGLDAGTFDQCLKGQQDDRQAMIDQWSSFSAEDRRHCIAEATMGGVSSYTDLVSCLEMSRDARKLPAAKDMGRN
jgi:hypothetical protein